MIAAAEAAAHIEAEKIKAQIIAQAR